MLTYSFEDLAQTFRVLVESNFSFHQLIGVDRAEAIGTIETAINAKLNAFHNLYDLMQQNGIKVPNWYDTPELCIILAIRNARHHNKANRIRSLYNYHRYTAAVPSASKEYFYVDFPAPPEEEGGDCFDVPLSWHDLDLFLSLPRKESRLQPETRALIRNYLSANKFEECAATVGIEKSEMFFNFVPLSLNAGIALSKHITPYVKAESGEAKFFLQHFSTMPPALTKEHETSIIHFYLPD